MLRFVRERSAWVVAALVVAILLAGLWMWGAAQLRAQASQLLSERFGVDAEIEDTRLGIRGVELVGVEVRGKHGGFDAHIERVDATMSLLGAAFRGARAVRDVSAFGVDVTVDLSDEGLEASLAEIRSRRASGASPPRPSAEKMGGRTYGFADLSVRVLDDRGALASVDQASLQKQDEELRLAVRGVALGEPNADHMNVGPVKASFRRVEGAWKLRVLTIDRASVRAVGSEEGQSRPLAVRVREALAEALAMVRGSAADPAPSGPPGTDAGAARASTGAPMPRDPTKLFTRLTPDAYVSVSDSQIESRTSRDHVERIRDFEWTLRGNDEGWYRIRARGETSNAGGLRVDLQIIPAEARAEGSIEVRRISLALLAPFVPEIPLYDTKLGHVSAELQLRASPSDEVSIEGGAKVRELALASERIAPEPIEHINVDVGGKGVWHAGERRLRIERGRLRMGEAQVFVEGELERTADHYRADLTAKLPPTLCNDVVGAIPDDVLGSLSRFEWSGNWSALTHISVDSRDLEATELSIRVRNLCEFVRAPRWVRVERFQGPFRHRVTEPDDTVFSMRTGPGTDKWVALADTSPFVPAAVISHEDGGFYDHAGFAPWAIRDAIVRNLQEGRYVVGASTITMQLAKNVYLQRDKNIARKVQEVILTWWLESALNKDEILELYLNVIEYGPGVYGLKQAAAYYFARSPADLSPAEAAFLACMLPSPKRYFVSYERGALSRSMKSRMKRLLEHMAKRQRIGWEALEYGLAELDDFRFHRPGDPPPPLRLLPPLGAPEAPAPEALDPFEALFVAP